MAEKLRYIIEDKLDMKLITIHEHPNADVAWELNTVYEELKNADIIIVPANFKRQPCKSANRLTQALSLGKPVVCDPMPSYIPIVKNFENAIILKNGTEDEWEFALSVLKENPSLREKLAKNGLATSKKYGIPNISRKWLELFNSLESKVIDVVIPTKRNIPIIKECLDSFKNSSLEEDVYIIDNDTDSNQLEELVKSMGIPYEVRDI